MKGLLTVFGVLRFRASKISWPAFYEPQRQSFASPSSASANVMMKLIDHEFLFVNNAFYKISNRDDAGYFSAFGDRQMYK